MKKVIIPFDGKHFSQGAFSFAQSLHQMKPILLTGVFLPAVDYARFFFFPSAFAAPAYMPVMEEFGEEGADEAAREFARRCEINYIDYRIHKDLTEAAIPQLTKESRFADLMILGSEIFYRNEMIYGSTEYLKDALHRSECPVVIVPENFNTPAEIILAYDGSASSIFAIKQFAYLFPELSGNKVILMHAAGKSTDIPDQVLIEELAARHFPDLSITALVAGSKSLTNWVQKLDSPMMVSGSFGRSGISELFNKSFMMDIIKEQNMPVFIAHR